jgi:hypothetical protein
MSARPPVRRIAGISVLSVALSAVGAQAQEQDDSSVEEGGPAALPTGMIELPIAAPTSLETLEEGALPERKAVYAFDWSIRAVNEVLGYDNRDLRALDERTDQNVIDTDDRRNFGYSDLTVTMSVAPVQSVRFDLQTQYALLWKEDQIGRQAGTGGSLRIFQLSSTWEPLVHRRDGVGLMLRFGRQPFSIGGVPTDYLLDATVDAITVTADFGSYGTLRVLALDFFGANDLPETGFQYYLPGRASPFGQRGETNTLRTGLVYGLDPSRNDYGLGARAFGFFATIGGGPIESTGSDISYGGTLGNFRDADYQMMFGGRLLFDRALSDTFRLTAFAEFARSEGIDRKELVARDVNTGGNAIGAGFDATVTPQERASISAGASFYHFDGASYASDGLEFERGFVSFRGWRVGGIALGRNAAWRPSAHMESYGIAHTPHSETRAAGTRFVEGRLGARVLDTSVRLRGWQYWDTSTSFVDFEALAAGELPAPPFGYTYDEFAAQERLGRSLGFEYEVEVAQSFSDDRYRLYGTWGAFVPSDFYALRVSRIVEGTMTALGGEETFWAFRVGAEVNF